MTTEVTTTIKMPKETLIRIKSLAVEKETSQKNIINKLLNQALNLNENKSIGLQKARKIQMPFTNPNKKGNLKDMGGIVEIDDNIDVNEVLDNIHTKKRLY